MMRSMYSGVAGLRVHQTKMDVIGNNIANVNTIGFKRSSVTFQEVFNQTIRGAGAPQGGRGGTNPQQIGLGVGVSSMTVNHSQSAPQSTGYNTDLMVDGNGYFILSNDVNAQNRFYTRSGNFEVDDYGFLTSANGYRVLDDNMKPIQINMSDIKPATATTGIEIKGNINTDATTYETSVDIFDSLGGVHTLTIEFGENIIDATNKCKYREIVIRDPDGNVLFGDPDPTATTDKRFLKFDSSGNYMGAPANPPAVPIQSLGIVEGNATMTPPFTVDGAGNIAAISVDGAEDIQFEINHSVFLDDNGNSILKQVSGTSDAKGVELGGNSAGSIDKYTISANGEVVGIFTNGERKTLSVIGLADFDNPSGLLKVGGNMYVESPNSGTPKYGGPATGGFGDLIPGSLEMSNVDLSLEFTDMISTQRGFQANSRIITTTDEMLQELVNLKR